jgi:hypothetical protein
LLHLRVPDHAFLCCCAVSYYPGSHQASSCA